MKQNNENQSMMEMGTLYGCLQKQVKEQPDATAVFDVRRRHVGTAIVCWLVEQARHRQIQKIYLGTSDMGRKMYCRLSFEEMKDMLKLRV